MGISASARRARKDHVQPRGYLRGFIHPNRRDLERPLWVWQQGQWVERHPGSIAWLPSFYEYPSGSTPDQTADDAFRVFENQFPATRDAILRDGFNTWHRHKNFLLSYGRMLYLRSALFREHHRHAAAGMAMWEIIEKPEELPTGPATYRVKPVVPNPAEREELLWNKAITDRRTEIAKGPDWLLTMDWALRYTNDPNDPIVTGNHPVIAEGRLPLAQAIQERDPNTVVFIPLSWQMCLVGQYVFNKETERLTSSELAYLRARYAGFCQEYLIAPVACNLS